MDSKKYKKQNKNLFKCFNDDKNVNLPSINSTVCSSGVTHDCSPLSNDCNNFLGKKRFVVRKGNIFRINNETSNGKWTEEEHKKFIEGLYIYNCSWCDIRQYILTRSPDQIRSHAQKFYKRLKDFKDDSLGLDFTLDSIQNLNDIIAVVKKKELESLSDTKDKLLFILSEKINFGKKCGKKKKKFLLSKNHFENTSNNIKNIFNESKVHFDENIEENINNFGNDYFWKNKDKSDLSLDTFSFGIENRINDYIYFRRKSF